MRIRLGLAALALLGTAALGATGPREAEWKEVRTAIQSGLPRTAIDRLGPIITAALAEGAYGEATNAIVRRAMLENEVEGRRAEDRIRRLATEVEAAPVEVRPLLQALLAHVYWQYYQQQRGRWADRTPTSVSGADLETWDPVRLLAEISRHFDAALAHPEPLQRVPIGTFDAVLEKGNAPDWYRPTLFDFIAHQALEFYQLGEWAALRTEDEVEVEAAGPVLGDVGDFLAWRPGEADAPPPALKAITLYQALLRFHANDTERSAFLDADFARLSYAANVAVGDAKDARVDAAFQRLAEAAPEHDVAARAYAVLARRADDRGDRVAAHAFARRGYAASPDSAGGRECFNRIATIEERSLEVEAEQVWSAPWPTIEVRYRNLDRLHFRMVRTPFEEVLRSGESFATLANRLVDAEPAASWECNLPATPDFQVRTEVIPVPANLAPGYYVLLASADARFGWTDNEVRATGVWVSNLAVVTSGPAADGRVTGLVVQAGSGEPVAGAKVSVWFEGERQRCRVIQTRTTDAEGRFEVRAREGQTILVAEHEGDAVASDGIHRWESEREDREPPEQTATVFFTDRAIYRPGQTIQYKGVAIQYAPDRGRYEAAGNARIKVVLKDANGEQVAHADHRTNDYGSFNGTFTAPRDRVTGWMTLEADERHAGIARFQVEEYKRPKFAVHLDAPAAAPKLGERAVLSGRATAYSGAAIGGARVRWRVERGVDVPRWCWWWQPRADQAIAHGTATTAEDGSFRVEFVAAPDRAVPVKNEPIFRFTLHADVTDTTGETRSEQATLRIGYTALQAGVSAVEWQTPERPVEIAVSTSSLDGSPEPAAGELTIFALRQPAVVQRARLRAEVRRWWASSEPPVDAANRESWEAGEVVFRQPVATAADGTAKLQAALPAGVYRAELSTADRFGRPVTARTTIEVLDPHADRYGVKVPNQVAAPQWSVQPGETFTAYWGTGYESGRAYVEVWCRGKVLQRFWTATGATQTAVRQLVTEAMRGGFTLRVAFVRENRAYLTERQVDVPWDNKLLSVKWETFRSKLAPGQRETWTAVVEGIDGKAADAEMAATLYDASLDPFAELRWPEGFDVFRREFTPGEWSFANSSAGLWPLRSGWRHQRRAMDWQYRRFPEDVLNGWRDAEEVIVLSPFEVTSAAATGYAASSTLAGTRIRTTLKDIGSAISVVTKEFLRDTATGAPARPAEAAATETNGSPDGKRRDLAKVVARRNLSETAFFIPQATTDGRGRVRLKFTMPESLTTWRFLGFAHDAQLRAGLLTGTAVTAKDLMVQPNPPRFVREGDAIEFTVKVSNQSDAPQRGVVKLSFADAVSLESRDLAVGNAAAERAFEVPAKQSRSFHWRVAVPDGLGFLTYKAVAATDQLSDGEEGFLPVLSRRILVTESLPLPIRGKQTKEFVFPKLLEAAKSDSLRHQSLTVQMTSQPAWYAVLALPYLMEYPYECSEQVFNRLYANALARHIANSDPKIRRVFEQWRNTPATDSPLQKNAELKSVLLEETPWVREARNESEARRNVGLLFEAGRLDAEQARAMSTLGERQRDDGLWPWFPGGPASEYISVYLVTGFGRLRHLGVAVDTAPAVKALAGLDAWLERRYREVRRERDSDHYVPGHLEVIYLYGRSFFLKERPVAAEHREAFDFFRAQLGRGWLQTDCRMCQAQGALALHRTGEAETARAILRSLKERSTTDEETGMFWRDAEAAWWWYRAPIETQATLIEAFDEVAGDARAVEDCKVWLLKQKQTQGWSNTKATADAIYALLLRGENLLASDARVEVSLGGEPVRPEKVEAGTGFYEQRIAGTAVRPAMGAITVRKPDAGVSWGSVHWQYLEDMAKVTPHEATPLRLHKTLWVKQTTARGPELVPVTGPVDVGDELVVRLELRTDRAMEFVHLKDQRGSGTEPVNVISQYKYQDGLAYYESTRDTASHFFIDYLPQGTYVFEYPVRVQLRGEYQTGIAEIQCMYAPEFNSHSESLRLVVR